MSCLNLGKVWNQNTYREQVHLSNKDIKVRVKVFLLTKSIPLFLEKDIIRIKK
jgi:hypothetical protein